MSTDSEGWRQQMEALIGMSPPEPEVEDGGKKDRVPADAPFTWIAANFAHCPEDSNDEVIQTYARVHMWSTKDGGVGGCMLLLSIWSWERLPVGRPKTSKWNTWDDNGNPVRLPTWAYKWDVVSEVASEVNLLYKQYTNKMDSLTAEQRKEVKKQADESEAILDKTPGGKKGEYALRLFIKEQGKKLRRLSNILGCHDREYVSPSRSGSSQRNTLDDSTSSGARMDDGDITSVANAQRNTLEDDVDTPEVADEMMLKAFQRSAYMLKPRKEFRRYSPDDYAKGKNPVAGGCRLSRMRSMDNEGDDDDDDELDDPEQFVVARRKKLAS
ncbi:hypothetical protein D1007_28707 [Hordeum vulgare]|nr:hypothetical protein D1007_28707 [Hordeum vulgare]